jgi:hypothetical protein
MKDRCPICGGEGCATYPLMVKEFAAGRNREHWRTIHDQMNGVAPVPSRPQASRVVPSSAAIRATQLGFHRCWFSTKDSECGCSGVRCHLKKRIVTLSDCVTCLGLDK